MLALLTCLSLAFTDSELEYARRYAPGEAPALPRKTEANHIEDWWLLNSEEEEYPNADVPAIETDENAKEALFDVPSEFMWQEADDDDEKTDDGIEKTDGESDIGTDFDGFVVRNAVHDYPFADAVAIELNEEDEYPFANTPAQE